MGRAGRGRALSIDLFSILPLTLGLLLTIGLWPAGEIGKSIVKATWNPSSLHFTIPIPQSTVLKIEVGQAGRFKIAVIGPDGRRVKSLLKEAMWAKGEHSLSWDGKDDQGRLLPSEAYTICIKENLHQRWETVWSPNAENHGQKAEISGLQDDSANGKLLFSVKRPSRIRVWAVAGNDGLILSTLKDMEPVQEGLLAIPWYGTDPLTGVRVALWGHVGFSFTGYVLPDGVVFIASGDSREYGRVRGRYPLDEDSVPKAYEDSSPLYRADYGEQKELRFSSSLDGNAVTITPDQVSMESFSRYETALKLFTVDGAWTQYELKATSSNKGSFVATINPAQISNGGPLIAVVLSSKDQWGHAPVGTAAAPSAGAVAGKR